MERYVIGFHAIRSLRAQSAILGASAPTALFQNKICYQKSEKFGFL